MLLSCVPIPLAIGGPTSLTGREAMPGTEHDWLTANHTPVTLERRSPALHGFEHVPVHDLCVKTATRQVFANVVRDHNRPVVATRASESDRQVALALANVVREQVDQ